MLINKKPFLKRLFCSHLNWTEGRLNGSRPHFDDYAIVMGVGKITPWTCNSCGTCKQFTGVGPIQYIDRT